jgi:hypothetical protein
MNAPEGANRPGRVQSGITIQRATGFPPPAPIPLNPNSLESQSLTSFNLRRIALAMVNAWKIEGTTFSPQPNGHSHEQARLEPPARAQANSPLRH